MIRSLFSGDSKTVNGITWIIAIEISLIMVIASFFLPGGDDYYRYYLPFSEGCFDCGFIPHFAIWILWPIKFIPIAIGWPVWTAISLTGWLGACWILKENPLLILLSFPFFGQIWLGQIDVIICIGLVFALMGKNPFVRGAGFALSLVKPQFAIIPLVFLLCREKEPVKVLIIPAITFILSLFVFGFGWPLGWVTNAMNNVPLHAWRLASRDIWIVGLLFAWVPFLFSDRRERFAAATLVTAIATPFVGVYSYALFLVFVRKQWWSLPLSYVWVIAYPLWGEEALRLAWLLPAVLLVHQVIRQRKNSLVKA